MCTDAFIYDEERISDYLCEGQKSMLLNLSIYMKLKESSYDHNYLIIKWICITDELFYFKIAIH